MVEDSIEMHRRLPGAVTALLLALAVALVVDMPWYLRKLLAGSRIDAHAYLHNALLLVLIVAFATLMWTDRRLRGPRLLWLLGAVFVTVPVWVAYLWLYEIRPGGRA